MDKDIKLTGKYSILKARYYEMMFKVQGFRKFLDNKFKKRYEHYKGE